MTQIWCYLLKNAQKGSNHRDKSCLRASISDHCKSFTSPGFWVSHPPFPFYIKVWLKITLFNSTIKKFYNLEDFWPYYSLTQIVFHMKAFTDLISSWFLNFENKNHVSMKYIYIPIKDDIPLILAIYLILVSLVLKKLCVKVTRRS